MEPMSRPWFHVEGFALHVSWVQAKTTLQISQYRIARRNKNNIKKNRPTTKQQSWKWKMNEIFAILDFHDFGRKSNSFNKIAPKKIIEPNPSPLQPTRLLRGSLPPTRDPEPLRLHMVKDKVLHIIHNSTLPTDKPKPSKRRKQQKKTSKCM